MLVNNGYAYGSWEVKETRSTDAIARIEKLVSKKQEEFDAIKYELEIANRERIRVYHENVRYGIDSFLLGAFKWFYAKKDGKLNGEKVDLRRKYEEKDSYNVFVDWLEKRLGVDDIEITEFSSEGMSTIGYRINFTSVGKEWSISIPLVDCIGEKEVKDWGGGDAAYAFQIKLWLVDREKSSYKLICRTFEENELKAAFATITTELNTEMEDGH